MAALPDCDPTPTGGSGPSGVLATVDAIALLKEARFQVVTDRSPEGQVAWRWLWAATARLEAEIASEAHQLDAWLRGDG